jgi:hypothetical protein
VSALHVLASGGGVNAFHVLGGILAVWAVVLAALGITRPEFPGGRGGERIVIAVSVILVVAAIGSAVITSASEEEEHGEETGLLVR